MARTTASRATFINSAIAFVRKYNFDGIDIDWEYPTGPQDKENFSAFLKEMLAAAEAEAAQSGLERLLLTAAVAAGESNINNGYDVPVIAQYLDFILLMSYDFHGAWESQTGQNSPLYAQNGATGSQKTLTTDWAANHWASKGMPRNKIIIGIGAYGRGWTLSNPSNTGLGAPGTAATATPYAREAGIAAYYELCEMLATGAKRFWDDEQKVPYLVNGNQWFGYDDVESVTIKMHYVRDQGFGGAFAWTLDFDDFNGQCSNGGGVRYPLLSLFGKLLGGSVVPTVQPPPPQTTTRTSRTTQPSTPPPVITSTSQPGAFRCTSDGFFPDPTSRNRFYRCVSGTAYLFNCPGSTVFIPEAGSCGFADASMHSL
uniref:Endochitinase n=2 Tax=Ascaris TaxID=6251 RepID=F1L1F6_ASCSU